MVIGPAKLLPKLAFWNTTTVLCEQLWCLGHDELYVSALAFLLTVFGFHLDWVWKRTDVASCGLRHLIEDIFAIVVEGKIDDLANQSNVIRCVSPFRIDAIYGRRKGPSRLPCPNLFEVEPYPCQSAAATMLAKVLQGKVTKIWGNLATVLPAPLACPLHTLHYGAAHLRAGFNCVSRHG